MLDLEEIGRNVALLRKARGLTQEETAYRSRLSVSRLQSIEYGCRNTTVDTLICLAGTLGVDSRVLGIFSRADEEILSEVRQSPQLPERERGALQVCGNILLLRKKEGLTQQQLAQLSGISAGCLRDIEHGCANMTTKKLVCIASAFGLSLLELDNLTTPEEELLEAVHAARLAVGIAGMAI